MARAHQEIRPSQFIFTYGPGSILETRSGPVVPKVMDELFTSIARAPSDFEISDERMTRSVLGGARITRVPTNAELLAPADDVVYPTTPFPFWSLCTRHGIEQVLYPSSNACPRCAATGQRYDREKAGREVIRFVLACPMGHLDDVPWNRLVHGPGSTCQPGHFVWRGGGRALRFVTLQCPTCGESENFGRAYGRPWLCSGRFVEVGNRPDHSECMSEAHIHQRGAANLHQSEIVSALTIVDMPARLHNVLSDARILATASTLRRHDVLTPESLIDDLRVQGIPEAALDIIRDTDWAEVLDALDQLGGIGALRPLKVDEFERLVGAAENGAPAVPSAHPGSPPMFEVRRSAIREFLGPSGTMTLRVTPISRLRMVTVQTGYRRVEPVTGELVSTMFGWAGVNWYPGVELFGEGIFIDLIDWPLNPIGVRASAWAEVSREAEDVGEGLQHPVHVWWHTLSHRLMRSLSVDSGYSSASIRERTYLANREHGAVGGLLLFTVQPGGDGTLGGLIALADRFGDILRSALSDVGDCSNDPLCSEAPQVGAPGAACYSCLLASETSCEHRNLHLDRLLLLENLP